MELIATYMHYSLHDARCDGGCTANKVSSQSRLLQFPQILSVQLGRHASLRGGRRHARVQIDADINLNDFVSRPAESEQDVQFGSPDAQGKRRLLPGVGRSVKRMRVSFDYSLFAVVMHLGSSATGGHYVAAIPNDDSAVGGWRVFDDARSTILPDLETMEKSVYMVFYHRV